MNQRGKRLTLGVMAVGLAVVLVLGIVHRETVRDHVEAWHFQLTRETETLPPLAQGLGTPNLLGGPYVRLLANCSGKPVVVERSTDPAFGLWFIISTEGIVQSLRVYGWRVIDQCFPREAWVIIRDRQPTAEDIDAWFEVMNRSSGSRVGTDDLYDRTR